VGNDVDMTLLPGSAGKLQTCSDRTTGECEPIEGGTQFDSDDLRVCTVTFAATYDSNSGFVSAGHCVDGLGNHDVNQGPASSKDLGNIEEETFSTSGTFACDCAFISETHASRSMSDRVFDMIDPVTTASPFVNMDVTMSGGKSDLENGDVSNIDDDWDVDLTGNGTPDITITNTIIADYASQDTDSGSPIMSGNSLIGMHIGIDDNGDRRFIKTSIIESEFSGLSWDF